MKNFYLIIILGFISCSPADKKPNIDLANKTNETIDLDTLTNKQQAKEISKDLDNIEQVNIQNTGCIFEIEIHGFNVASPFGEEHYINVQYPVIKSNKTNKLIKKLNMHLKAEANITALDIQKMAVQFKDSINGLTQFEISNITYRYAASSILFNRILIIKYQLNETFNSKNKLNVTSHNVLYDMKTGTKLNWGDVFKSSLRELWLNTIVQEYEAREMRPITSEEKNIALGEFNNGSAIICSIELANEKFILRFYYSGQLGNIGLQGCTSEVPLESILPHLEEKFKEEALGSKCLCTTEAF